MAFHFSLKPVALLSASSLCLALLAGCGSNVKLDDAPVADSTSNGAGTTLPVTTDGAAGAAGGTALPRAVPLVNAGGDEQGQPPASVARTVYFDFDSFLVRPEFVPTLEAHAKFLKADPARRVTLQGHTDERGGREYNLALGQKRAEAVRRSLSLMGVTETQQEAVSFGKEKPAASGGDETAHQQNRRVELSYR